MNTARQPSVPNNFATCTLNIYQSFFSFVTLGVSNLANFLKILREVSKPWKPLGYPGCTNWTLPVMLNH